MSESDDQQLPFLSANKIERKNLLCVVQKSADFVTDKIVRQGSACSISDDFVGQLFVYRSKNFV